MGVSQLYTCGAPTQQDSALRQIRVAVQSLHPISSQPWERTARFWSQRKVGQDEEQIKQVVVGVLAQVASIPVDDACVLVHAPDKSEPKVVEGDKNAEQFLRSLQYNLAKEVVFSGTEYSFGDMAIIAGGVMRRTNDLQQMGAFVCFKHKQGSMISKVQPALDSMKLFLFESLKGLQCDVRFSEVKPAKVKTMGNYYTPCHEALCFHHIASR